MRRPNKHWTLFSQLSTLILLGSCLAGCGPQKAAPAAKTAPAKIEHPDESNIYRVVLTPKAEERLQISTVPVEMKAVPRTRTVGGEIAIPDGASVIVTAPVTGQLLRPSDTATLVPGQSVSAGQTIFQLRPLLSPEREVPTAAERVVMADAKATLVSSQIIADGDAKQAQAQIEAAQIALDRAKRFV
jgi:membrane fusion protein, heavy metal efflux system